MNISIKKVVIKQLQGVPKRKDKEENQCFEDCADEKWKRQSNHGIRHS